MKIKAIAAVFKRNKSLTVYDDENGEQWISNGAAMYSMRGMPPLTPETVLKIFDVPADKHSDWICQECELPKIMSLSGFVKWETEIEPEKINIEYFGDKYWLFPDGDKIYALNEEYLKPLLDEREYLVYGKRTNETGGLWLQ